jgi:methylmalonyl-CoA/ethylmalonyl-CoA epimerase
MSPLELGPIDHVGIIVADLGEARELYTGLGFTIAREAQNDKLGIRAAFLAPPAGGPTVEAIELTEPGRRGFVVESTALGLDHIALRVADLDAALAFLAERGIEMTTEALSLGVGRTVFTRPETSGGIVYQFVEPPK